MTAWRWWRNGKLPVPAYHPPLRFCDGHGADRPPGRIVLYARVASLDQAHARDRHVARVSAWATAHGRRGG